MNDESSSVDSTYRVTAAELRAFIERYERLETEKKDIADQQKEVMAEAKGRGYDVKVLRKLVALRKKDPAELFLSAHSSHSSPLSMPCFCNF